MNIRGPAATVRDDNHDTTPFGVNSIRRFTVQWCLKSLHKQACTSNELGVSKNVSEQSIIFLTLGYNRLKQSGNVDLIQAREDQLINIFNLLDRRITHVITIWETFSTYTQNLKANSSINKPSLSPVKTSRNSCSSVNFLAGPDFSKVVRLSEISIPEDANRLY